MKSEFYLKMVGKIKSHQKFCVFLVRLSKIATLSIYAFYPLMLLYLALFKNSDLLKAVLVPAISFLIVSVVRYLINFPRPYEKIEGLSPLYNKKTVGKSFPSRHTFSAFVIGVTALYFNLYVGIAVLTVGLIIAISRVLCGVHFIRDVLVGAVFGAICGIVGMFVY